LQEIEEYAVELEETRLRELGRAHREQLWTLLTSTKTRTAWLHKVLLKLLVDPFEVF
jgi:hypothetical protein